MTSNLETAIGEYVRVATVLAKEAFNAAGMKIRIEEYYSDEGGYTIRAIRFPTGIGEEEEQYSELVFVLFKEVLDQKNLDRLADEISQREFFKYSYCTRLYSRSVYVFAKRYDGKFIRAKRGGKRYQFVVPVLGQHSFVQGWIYYAEFLRRRLDKFIDSLFGVSGWKSKTHVIWSKFQAMLKLNVRQFSLLRMSLYYIDRIESKLEEAEESRKFSSNVIKTGRILLRIFKTLLKEVDEILKPYLKKEIAKEACRILKDRFGSLNVVKFVMEYLEEADRRVVKKYLDLISQAAPVRG